MPSSLVQRSTEAVCSALLPREAGGPDASQAAREIERYLSQLPRQTQIAIKAGFVGIAAIASGLGGRPLGDLPVDERTGVIERLANARPELEGAIDGLKSALLLSHGAESASADLNERSQRHAPAREDAELFCTSSAHEPSTVRCDAVVIGSGAGGAMAARTLAQADREVVILEEGRRWTVDEFREGHPIDRYAQLYRGGGATIAIGRPPVVMPIGRAVGGTTVVNSGTCFRPPPGVQRRWSHELGFALADPDTLKAHLDDVERTLRVGPVPSEVMGRNGALLLAGAKELGWSSHPLIRNAPGCEGCCQCALGCPSNAKFGVHLNALPQACLAGARIISDARVLRVLHGSGRASGVLAKRPDGSTFEVAADTVVVAAGATETPPLLTRSGLGGHPRLGRNLSVHPAIGLAGRFPEKVVAWHGVLQSAAVDELHRSHGILIEATSTPPGMGSLVLPGYGPNLVQRIADADHFATFGAMIGDEPSGRIIGRRSGDPLMQYNLSRRDAKKLIVALSAMGRIMFAAGAEEVFTALPGRPSVHSVAELDDTLASANTRTLHVTAFHPTGTAAGGSDDQRAPVDERGRLRGVEGVWVADASVIPSCPEVNPQVSIMAVALAIGAEIVDSTA